jgi:DNA-binding NtrC family response regulator
MQEPAFDNLAKTCVEGGYDMNEAIATFKAALIVQFLAANRGNISCAARQAEQHRNTFWRVAKQLKVDTVGLREMIREDKVETKDISHLYHPRATGPIL